MDENAPMPDSGIDSAVGNSVSAAAASTMRTYNFIFNKYRAEFEAAMNYDEKKDRKYQNQMRKLAREKEPFYDHRCFLCQQSAEKYLKALLEECAIPVTKTHDLEQLVNVQKVLGHTGRANSFYFDFKVGKLLQQEILLQF